MIEIFLAALAAAWLVFYFVANLPEPRFTLSSRSTGSQVLKAPRLWRLVAKIAVVAGYITPHMTRFSKL